MLEALSTIDWSKLEDAYGKATEVPLLLQRLATGDATAIRELAGRIDHQGTPSPVSEKVVPFLWEIALGTVGPTRTGTLILLGDLSVGGAHQNFLGAAPSKGPARILVESPEAQRLRAAVAARAVELIPLLADSSINARATAGFVLALTLADGAVEAILTAMKKEKDLAARASHAISLGYALEAATPKQRTTAITTLKKLLGKKDLAAQGAAIGLAVAGAIDDEVKATLLEAASTEPSTVLPWNSGDIAAHATEVLLEAASEGGADALVALVGIAPESLRGAVASVALSRVFRQELAKGSPASPSTFDESQRRVLRMIQTRDDLYNGPMSPVAVLEKLELPYLPWELGTLLGDARPRPSPLDRELEFQGRTRSIREHWLDAARENDSSGHALARSLASALEPHELVRVAIEGALLKVEWQAKASELCLLCLVDKGATVAAPLTSELERLEVEGAPKLWSHGPLGARATYLGQVLLIAAEAVQVSTELLDRLRKHPAFSAPPTLKGLCNRVELAARTREIAQTYVAKHGGLP